MVNKIEIKILLFLVFLVIGCVSQNYDNVSYLPK